MVNRIMVIEINRIFE